MRVWPELSGVFSSAVMGAPLWVATAIKGWAHLLRLPCAVYWGPPVPLSVIMLRRWPPNPLSGGGNFDVAAEALTQVYSGAMIENTS